MNWEAVDKGAAIERVEVPASWASAEASSQEEAELPGFIANRLKPMNAQKGDNIPVSEFVELADGTFENGSSAFEKRGIAVNVPEWLPENCIQCNQCSYVCPHAAIRPFLLTEEEKANAPEGFTTLKAMGKDMGDYGYKIQVSTLDCTGCGNCADICPAKNTALVMKPLDSQTVKEIPNWDYAVSLPVKDDLMATSTVKGSQFAQPLFEFSGACAGCGETPYMKLVTQLYGDRMLVANATGCSSIWGGSAPSTPYCKNAEGKGPAWANSLFEDNAEYGYGMALAVKTIRKQMAEKANALLALNVAEDIKAPFKAWVEGMEDADASKKATIEILAVLEKKLLTLKRRKSSNSSKTTKIT